MPYGNFMQCNWQITAHPGYRIRLDFVGKFKVYCKREQCRHWVEVKYQEESMASGSPGARFCCYSRPQVQILSENQKMLVLFRSNWTAHNSNKRLGFQARVRAGEFK